MVIALCFALVESVIKLFIAHCNAISRTTVSKQQEQQQQHHRRERHSHRRAVDVMHSGQRLYGKEYVQHEEP